MSSPILNISCISVTGYETLKLMRFSTRTGHEPSRPLNHAQLFTGGRQDLAPRCRHHHGIFDANAAETFQVHAWLDGHGHPAFQPAFVPLADARRFVNLQAES